MPTFIPLSLAVKQALLTRLCEDIDDAIFILDSDLRYLSINAAYKLMIGYDEAFLLGRPLGIYAAEFLSEDERAMLKNISAHLDGDGFYENSFSMATRYGQMLECHITYRRIEIDGDIYHVGRVRDISENVQNKKRVTHLLNYDQLTGLPNRKIFLSQASDVLIDSYEEVVMARLNIDRYRLLVSTLGQGCVDTVVKDFVARINALKLDNLLCFAHFGGDDFGLLFECSDANIVRHYLDKLMQACERPFVSTDSDLNDTTIYLHVSIGISYFPEHSNRATELMNKAEQALSYSKQKGGDDVCWYQDNLNNIANDDLQLEAQLRQALDEHQFEPFYQPKLTLDTGAITGFEALARWRHPTRGILKPDDFMAAIIKHKLSFELFCHMAQHIAQQLSHWQALGLTQHICINADATEFSDSRFVRFIQDLLTQYNIQAQQLHIEVTESSLMLRHANVTRQLNTLKALGIGLALDDFGTGYASLSYLQEYPFDVIKIDKSFISKIVNNRTQQAIVKAILDLALALDMSAIAEGIETQEQCDVLLAMGCTDGQGYWFSEPVAADIATAMLAPTLPRNGHLSN